MPRLAYMMLLALLGVAIIHIATILLIPQLMANKSFSYYSGPDFAYRFSPLARDDPQEQRKDPLFDLALCYFNLDAGPLHLYSSQATPFWSLSIYNKKGFNLYSINSYAFLQHELDLIITKAYQSLALNGAKKRSPGKEIILPDDFQEGLIILRSFSNAKDNSPSRFLHQARCRLIASEAGSN